MKSWNLNVSTRRLFSSCVSTQNSFRDCWYVGTEDAYIALWPLMSQSLFRYGMHIVSKKLCAAVHNRHCFMNPMHFNQGTPHTEVQRMPWYLYLYATWLRKTALWRCLFDGVCWAVNMDNTCSAGVHRSDGWEGEKKDLHLKVKLSPLNYTAVRNTLFAASAPNQTTQSSSFLFFSFFCDKIRNGF